MRILCLSLAFALVGLAGTACRQKSSTAASSQVEEALSSRDRVPEGGMEKRPGDSDSATPSPTATPEGTPQ